jgi:hypothetical protein
MKRRVLLLIVLSMLLTGSAAYAHHSFAATYYEDRVVMMLKASSSNSITQSPFLRFRHGADEKGAPQRWAIGGGAVAQLNGQGVSRFTLKPGDKVVITGAPARSGKSTSF